MNGRPNIVKWLVQPVVILLVAGFLLELALRIYPRAIPLSYRNNLPLKGVEWFDPGILERTPIDGVPMPFDLAGKWTTRVPTPTDLVNYGVASGDVNHDRSKYGKVHFLRDDFGLANRKILNRADVILIGDSFAWAAGVNDPPGLVETLQDLLDTDVYNIGIPGVGPSHQRYMLLNHGLNLQPESVVWLYFGGNDLTDEVRLIDYLEKGITTHRDLYPDLVYPKSRAFYVMKKLIEKKPVHVERTDRSLDPFIYPSNSGEIPVWLFPPYLRNLIVTQKEWQEHPGWARTQTILKSASETLDSSGIQLLLVYVPTKPEVYLPYVSGPDSLLFAMTQFGHGKPIAVSEDSLRHLMMQNRYSQERMMSQFAQLHGIEFLSLNPPFQEAAQSGILCYLTNDTHWNPEGQQVAAKAIAAALLRRDE